MISRDYASALHQLLPPGVAWEFDKASDSYKLLKGLTTSFQRVDDQAQLIVGNLLPGQSVELIREWEAFLGVPDNIKVELNSLKERQLFSTLLLNDDGNQSLLKYKQLAVALAVPVKISLIFASRAQAMRAGGLLITNDRLHVIYLEFNTTGVAFNITTAKAGKAKAGYQIRYKLRVNNPLYDMLLHLFKVRKPAHVKLLENYYPPFV